MNGYGYSILSLFLVVAEGMDGYGYSDLSLFLVGAEGYSNLSVILVRHRHSDLLTLLIIIKR